MKGAIVCLLTCLIACLLIACLLTVSTEPKLYRLLNLQVAKTIKKIVRRHQPDKSHHDCGSMKNKTRRLAARKLVNGS